MINDVSEALLEWLEPIEIIRPGIGSYIDGKWADGIPTPVSIKAVVQNAQPNDLILLPEGTRSTEAVKLHTTTKINTVSEVGETNADTFTYDGDTYKIYDVFKRKIGNYYKGIAIRIKL